MEPRGRGANTFSLINLEEEELIQSACMMSFITVASGSHFPIQNLPYGVFSTANNVSYSGVSLCFKCCNHVLACTLLCCTNFL